ncbi:MAG: hypothetical protein C4320_06045, partial [Armatimonadota bacterium]
MEVGRSLMTTVAAPLAEPELQGFTPVETDLDQQGRLGLSRLEVVDGHLRRIEQTLSGDFVALDVPVNALSEIRTEDLVDAIALVAQHDGRTLELIRASTRRAGVFSSAQRQLAALVKGEPVPPPDSLEGTCPKCGRPLGGNSNVCEACLDRGQTLKRLFSYTLPFRGRMAWGVALSIFGMAFELLPPYLTKLLFDEGLGQKNFKFFVLVILMLLGSRIFATALQIARGRNVAWLGMMISRSIRHSLFEKLQRLSLSFYDKRNVGSLMSRMTNDTSALYDVLVDGIPVVVNQALLLIFIPAAILLLNWKIGLIAILPIPFVLFAVNRFRRKMNRVWNRVHHQNSRLSGTLNGILQGTRVVKAFHGEDREVLRFNRRVTALTDASYLAENSWATFFPLVVLTMGLSIILVYFVGGKAVLDDSITIGSLVAFVAYVQRLNEPLMMLQRLIDWSTRALTAAERVFEILDTPIDVQDSAQAIPMPEIQGRVSLKDVHFGYEKSREILHGLNFEASPGEMIGVVGPSGSGKTTLISLLLRFYDPTSGRIELDGVDLREIQLEDFRRQVGVVLQE